MHTTNPQINLDSPDLATVTLPVTQETTDSYPNIDITDAVEPIPLDTNPDLSNHDPTSPYSAPTFTTLMLMFLSPLVNFPNPL
jgi:hypothetical protein